MRSLVEVQLRYGHLHHAFGGFIEPAVAFDDFGGPAVTGRLPCPAHCWLRIDSPSMTCGNLRMVSTVCEMTGSAQFAPQESRVDASLCLTRFAQLKFLVFKLSESDRNAWLPRRTPKVSTRVKIL